jgi:hypothetical protein
VPAEVANDPRRNETLAMRIAPIDKGRVCVTGWFGRAWVGLAKFDGRKAAVKVIHEAKELPRQGDMNIWQNPKLTFIPEYARTLRGKPGADGKAPVGVLIGRGWSTSPLRDGASLPPLEPYPLLVDPDAGTVETGKEPIRVAGWSIAWRSDTAGGSIHVPYRRGGGGPETDLYRIDYPGKVTNLGELALPQLTADTKATVVGDRLYLTALDTAQRVPQPGGDLGYTSLVWASDLDGKNLRKVAEKTLRMRNVQHSSHYGLVVWCDLGDSLTRWVCNEFVQEPKK